METFHIRVSREHKDMQYMDYNICTAFHIKAPNVHDAKSIAVKKYQEQFPDDIEKYNWPTWNLTPIKLV